MSTLLQDLRYGLRTLLKSPGFTVVALLALALGIGANTTIFSAVNAVLLRPLPFPEAERLMALQGINRPLGIADSNMSAPDFADWQAQTQTFAQLTAFVTGGALLVANNEGERVPAAGVSADFFPVMRVGALKGRTLQADDARPNSSLVVVLSYGLWQRRFGADPNVIGTQVQMAGKSATIVGVMPPGFDYPAQSELWAPFPIDAGDRRDNRYLQVIGRLKPGATLQQAQAELDTINQRLAQTYHETNNGWGVQLQPLRERLVGHVRTALLVLLGAVTFVLLIACANVANLLLARATARQKEIAVRTALGASRRRIVQQLLTESITLAVIGGALGLLLSVWLTDLLVALSPPHSPRFDEIKLDGHVLAFTLLLTLATGLFFGLAPALQASRPDLNEALKEGGRTGSEGARRNRLRALLLVGEIALSFMLLAGAGLLIRSFMHLRDVSPGFNPEHVLTVRLSEGATPHKQGAERVEFFRQAIERVKALPGVEHAGAVLSLPVGGDTFNVWRAFIREGRPMTPEESSNAAFLAATPGYFGTLQIPLIAGRDFTEQDTDKAPMVVIVNEKMARQMWPGANAIGKRITIWRDEKFPREIVGVVGNTKPALDTDDIPQMYVPYAQDGTWGSLSLVVRATGDPVNLVAPLRREMRAFDPSVPVYNVRTMNEVVAASVASNRASMLLLSAFAAVALLLALIGIYGVTAYYVTQRTHEIGVRMALGAQPRDVLRLVLGQGLTLALVGTAVGLCAAFALMRVLTTLLYDIKPTDATTFAVVALALIGATLLACYIPARRATKVDPMVALRYE